MIAIVQLVDSASVCIKDMPKTKRATRSGLIVFLGISKSDTEKTVDKLASKLLKLRIFPDEDKKMNLDILTVKSEILLISQFTLLGDVKGNNRPSFYLAADKEIAIPLYQQFADKLTKVGLKVKTGFFGEHMDIKVNLNGPVTIVLDSDKI
jgi:D-tyrosyl-tRNA(Tyr) deacylase